MDSKLCNYGLFFLTPVVGFMAGASAPVVAAVTMVFGVQAIMAPDYDERNSYSYRSN